MVLIFNKAILHLLFLSRLVWCPIKVNRLEVLLIRLPRPFVVLEFAQSTVEAVVIPRVSTGQTGTFRALLLICKRRARDHIVSSKYRLVRRWLQLWHPRLLLAL